MQTVGALLEQFKASFAKEELDTCVKQLAQLKIGMLSFSALPPAIPSAPSSSQQLELLLARDVLEYGALVSIKTVDIPAFERHVAQVKASADQARTHTRCCALTPPSPAPSAQGVLHRLRRAASRVGAAVPDPWAQPAAASGAKPDRRVPHRARAAAGRPAGEQRVPQVPGAAGAAHHGGELQPRVERQAGGAVRGGGTLFHGLAGGYGTRANVSGCGLGHRGTYESPLQMPPSRIYTPPQSTLHTILYPMDLLVDTAIGDFGLH